MSAHPIGDRLLHAVAESTSVGPGPVGLAALGVFGTGTPWPDLTVAAIPAGLGLTAPWQIVTAAADELRIAPQRGLSSS